MKIKEEEVCDIIEKLRTHALQKLADRETFKQSGKAKLKIKFSGMPKKVL